MRQLLFLYVLEYEICFADFIFYNRHMDEWHVSAIYKKKKVGKEKNIALLQNDCVFMLFCKLIHIVFL